MAQEKKKLVIELFRKKDAEAFTAALADPEGKMEIPSAAALCGAEACALALRAARIAAGEKAPDERTDYLLRNLDKLREYLVYLIDEDVKGRAIFLRAQKEGDAQKIDAARHPACAIGDEIICQMIHLIALMDEMACFHTRESAGYLSAALELALSAMRCAMDYVCEIASDSSDRTYAFVVRRENELRMEELAETLERIRLRIDPVQT